MSVLSLLAKCKVVITFNQGLRGGRVMELKKIVDEAVKHCPTVQHVLVAHRTDNKVHMGDLDIPLEQVGYLTLHSLRRGHIKLAGSETSWVVVLNLGSLEVPGIPLWYLVSLSTVWEDKTPIRQGDWNTYCNTNDCTHPFVLCPFHIWN